MMGKLFPSPGRPAPRVPAGRRVYAVGDVHGRLDLLLALLETIRADHARRGEAPLELILLGDVIDRGHESRGVVRWAMSPPDDILLTVLMGNHEAALLAALNGNHQMLEMWLDHGGWASLASWDVCCPDPETIDHDALIEDMHRAFTREEVEWLAATGRCLTIGDYHFVHAGVRPGRPIAAQRMADTLWIRDEFLNSSRDHGAVVVHGHSVSDDVVERPNRIALDTGAYRTGRLTAMAFEEDRRWIIQVQGTSAAEPNESLSVEPAECS